MMYRFVYIAVFICACGVTRAADAGGQQPAPDPSKYVPADELFKPDQEQENPEAELKAAAQSTKPEKPKATAGGDSKPAKDDDVATEETPKAKPEAKPEAEAQADGDPKPAKPAQEDDEAKEETRSSTKPRNTKTDRRHGYIPLSEMRFPKNYKLDWETWINYRLNPRDFNALATDLDLGYQPLHWILADLMGNEPYPSDQADRVKLAIELATKMEKSARDNVEEEKKSLATKTAHHKKLKEATKDQDPDIAKKEKASILKALLIKLQALDDIDDAQRDVTLWSNIIKFLKKQMKYAKTQRNGVKPVWS